MTPRQRIFNTIKEEIITSVEAATFENLEDVEHLTKTLFGYAHYLNEVPNMTEPTEHEDYFLKDESLTEKEDTDETSVEPLAVMPQNAGVFHRNLSNGIIDNRFGERIFVPESIIRELDMEQGDVVQYIELSTNSLGKTFYEYEILHKSTKEVETDRVEFNNAVVERDPYDNSLCITESIAGIPIASKQSAFISYVIPEHVVDRFDLRVGSIVDVAWKKDKPGETFKIVWKQSS